MKKLLGLLLTANLLYANIVVFGDKYQVAADDSALEIIYSKEQENIAQKAKSIEKEVLKRYEQSYGFALDDTLHLGLASSHNQIANAFSTQFPLNMQINYIGGAYIVDYMSSTSWLKTLLLHESAHNFQLNAKKNPVSKFAYKIVKNTPVTSVFFIPIFPLPNIFENSFLLEGNAVFNESRYNNGGRLYNGAHLAMVITQAKAGYITPKRTYNDHLYFPYATHHYIVGGFFQLFLAKTYGVDKVNEYFWNFSAQYLPIQTSTIFKKTFGANYKQTLSAYSNWLQNEHAGFKASEGEVIAASKYHRKLNSTKDEIHFLTSDALSKPKLQIFSKNDKLLKSKKTNSFFGKVFKIDEDYYTSASSHTAVNRIEMGLFDEKGRVLEKSRSKIIQRVLSDGEFVYFDPAKSFEQPALFTKDKFYDFVNSSVFSDEKDNLYYFKQENKTRTLYKNKEPLFSHKGWYGFVTDVNENGIVFIASSEHGSSVYLYDGNVSRLSSGDDIVDAKLIDQNSMLLAVITAEGYNYLKAPIVKTAANVHQRTLFFEDREDFKFALNDINSSLKSKPYVSYKNLQYSSLSHSFIIDKEGVDFSIGANFADPLGQNSANIFISRFDEETLGGVGYKNSSKRLKFGANIYGVLENDDTISSRDLGANLFANYPFYKAGYTIVDADANYHINHDRSEKKPLSLSINYKNSKSFGKSMYANNLNSFSLFGIIDRSDKTTGLKYNFFHDLEYEFYMNLGLKYAKSSAKDYGQKRGIKIDNSFITLQSDPSHFKMPSLKSDIYAKEVFKGSLGIYKVFNFNAYSFKSPISLRRESIYTKYNYYDITFLNDNSRDFNEYIFGLTLDLIVLNKNKIPLSFEYIYSDDLNEANHFRVLFDLPL